MSADSNKCPACGASPCYFPLVGSDVECSNIGCAKYSKDLYPINLAPPVLASEANKGDCAPGDPSCDGCSCNYVGADAPDAVDAVKVVDAGTAQGVVYTWSTHHHDFGD